MFQSVAFIIQCRDSIMPALLYIIIVSGAVDSHFWQLLVTDTSFDTSVIHESTKKRKVFLSCANMVLRVREISIYFDFVAFYFTAHNRKLRKVPWEFFKL
jgi:hypothetical protein